MRSEETQKKILESDIPRTPESEGATEIGAPHKVPPPKKKFVPAPGSRAAKEKPEDTETQCRFGDSQICLNFHRRVGVLSEMRENLFLWLFSFLSSLVTRQWDSHSPILEMLYPFSKEDISLTRKLGMVNGMLKSSPRERIQRYYRGKSLSMVGSRGMFSLRKRWCCATGAKLGTCLARIVLWLHPLLKILACL